MLPPRAAPNALPLLLEAQGPAAPAPHWSTCQSSPSP